MLRERRRHARLSFRPPVISRFGEQRFKATSVNLGANGMALEPSRGLKKGRVVNLEFLLPGANHQLRFPARVPRMELPDRIALGYIDLSPDNKAALRDYIAGLIET